MSEANQRHPCSKKGYVMQKVFLASRSPRRSDLLTQIGLAHEIVKPHVREELLEHELPHELVARLAAEKLNVAAKKIKDKEGIIIAADTIVTYGGEILGKPRSMNDGAAMLQKLSGKTHEVLTGFAIRDIKRDYTIVDYEATTVEFRKLTDKEILKYSRLNESRDAAGSYAIQGAAAKFVKRIEGEYANVVGLPVGRIMEILTEEFDY